MKTSSPTTKKNPQPKRQAFSEHLLELRSRILLCVSVFILGSIAGYFLHNQISEILTRPLDQQMYYVSPAGGFDYIVQISLLFGLLVSLPITLYQIIRFVEPAMPTKARYLFITLIGSAMLLLLGLSFAYFIGLPATLYFLNTFSTDQVTALITTSEYLDFITKYILGFGIIFQLPLILVVINSLKRISIATLLKYEKWVIVCSFIFAALFTATADIINQLIMALPLILLYQISIMFIWLINRRTAD